MKNKQIKGERENIRVSLSKVILITIILLISLSFSLAYPVPIGIDGVVYDLDNITWADNTVMFSVKDINSGYYIEDNLRYDGSYSVAIKGDPGDIIIVRAWTPYHNISENITVEGVLHNFNLYLNLSIPNKAPKINSTPIIKAYEELLYKYNVEVNDDNGELFFSLEISPDNMTINNETGLITWLPIEKDIGLHNVTVKVTDGEYDDEQSYILEVIETNDAPLIISQPVTTATVGKQYYYDVDAVDPENDKLVYSLLEKPQRMHIISKTGRILWVPHSSGDYKVIVQVNDSQLIDTQDFVIEVKPLPKRRSRHAFTSVLKKPYVVTGLINYSDNEPVGADLEYEITNLQTNETITGKTMDGFNAYSEVITGELGDELEIKVGKGDYKETTPVKITGGVIREDITLRVSETELVRKSIFPVDLSIVSWLILLTLPFALIFRIAYLHYKK